MLLFLQLEIIFSTGKNLDLDSFIKSGTILSASLTTVFIGSGKKINSEAIFFYFPDYFLSDDENGSHFSHENTQEVSISDFLFLLKTRASTEKPDPISTWDSPNATIFAKAFSDLKTKIEAGELQKAVPYAFDHCTSEVTAQRLVQTLISVLEYAQKTNTYIYGTWDALGGILGATPELLFELNNNTQTLKTVACAGTCPTTPENKKLLESAKDTSEHQFVIDGIKDSMSPLGTVSTGKCYVRSLPNLSHLITPIEVVLHNKTDFITVVRALHPTPALGAYPLEQGKQWLVDYQTMVPRGRFGAPTGFVDQKSGYSVCYVAIRNMQWDESTIRVGAGCGVIKESVLEREWQEILLKLKATKSMLSL